MVNEVFARKRSKAARVVEGMHKGSADGGQQTRKVLRDCNAHLAVLIGGMDGLGQQAGRRNGASGQGRSEEAKREERGQSRCVKRRVVIRGDRSGADGR
jgi:hypothetical protein